MNLSFIKVVKITLTLSFLCIDLLASDSELFALVNKKLYFHMGLVGARHCILFYKIYTTDKNRMLNIESHKFQEC